MSKIEFHKRINDMLLGPLERPALQWLSSIMPSWVNPDILTTFGIFGVVLILFGYFLTNYDKNFLWLASLGFLINWLGDSLDGTLARFRKIERPKYGFFVDHSLDSLSTILTFVGLGLSPYVNMSLSLLTSIGYLLASIITYINTIIGGEFVISYVKIGPTEMRTIAILFNTALFFFGNPELNIFGGSVSFANLFIATIGAFLFTGSVVITITEIARWSKLDPPKNNPYGKDD